MSLGEEYQNFDGGMNKSELFYPGTNTIISNSLKFSESEIPYVSEFYKEEISFFNDQKKTYLCKYCNDFPLLEHKDNKFIHLKCSCIEGKTTLEKMLKYGLKLVEDEAELKKQLGCKDHNKQYISFCNKCKKNLCEDCSNQCHSDENHSNEDFLVFNVLNEKIIDQETHINNIFEYYALTYKGEKEKITMLNQNDSIAMRREEKIEKYQEIRSLFSLYMSILYSKDTFPNYNHYVNLENLYNYYFLDKLEMKYLVDKDISEIDINILGKKFVDNNKNNCNLIINGNKLDLCEQYKYKKKKKEREKVELIIILAKERPIENMSEMFKGCDLLRSVSVKTQWIMDKVTDISSMFYGCKILKYFKSTDWNTSEVKDFSQMFYNCKSLKEISGGLCFKTEKAENFSNMFYGCEALKNKNIDYLLEWETSNVTNMSYMFNNCKALQEINLSNWEMSKVDDLAGMFRGCESLKSIIFNTKINSNKVRTMNYMFAGCKNLNDIANLNKFNTERVESMSSMFKNCLKLRTLNLTEWDTKKVKSMNSMFQNCSGLEQLIGLSEWNVEKVVDMSNMFQNCSSLEKFSNISKWKIENPMTDGMFDGFSEEVEKPSWVIKINNI